MASRLALLPRTLRRSLQRTLSSASPVTGSVRFSCVLSTPAPPSLLRTNAVACVVSHRRFLKSETSEKVAQQDYDESEWTTIFRYPYIRFVQLLCRFKIYQCLATFAVAPPLLLSEYMQWTPTNANAALLSLMASATVVLFLTGIVSERIVGIMYVNKDCTKLRVARLNFWGRRQDHVYDVKDVAHFADSGQAWGSWYVELHRFSAPNDPLIVSLKQGGIVDKELFTKVFGHDVA
uniref:Transmembrane protein 186 n=1 Tax=Rhipicephalus appendiculatus TaxID=34631 RepID=A0A131Z5X0_RHIAP